jgi:tRNA (guanine37-N1)-methyltransferase
MKIIYISIFPDIYQSFLRTSLIEKRITSGKLQVQTFNPRDRSRDKHRNFDDQIYGGWEGLLMKAEPMIDCIEAVIKSQWLTRRHRKWKIIVLGPSQRVLDQHVASNLSKYETLIMVSGRYEGIDHRVWIRLQKHYARHSETISIGRYILLGGEVASMVLTEAIVRLIPGMIGNQESLTDESYHIDHDLNNIEYPQYTRPEIVRGMKVPDILLTGHHKNIAQRKQDHMSAIDPD